MTPATFDLLKDRLCLGPPVMMYLFAHLTLHGAEPECAFIADINRAKAAPSEVRPSPRAPNISGVSVTPSSVADQPGRAQVPPASASMCRNCRLEVSIVYSGRLLRLRAVVGMHMIADNRRI